MSYSFTYQDIDFGGENYRVYVTGTNYQQMPEPRVNVDRYAQADGAAIQGSTFNARRIALRCQLVASDATNRATQMDNVVAALVVSQATGPGDLSIDQFPGKLFTNAKLLSDITAAVYARMEEFTLEFICDSWPSATDATEGDGSNAAGGITSI